jgi:hypothetical protein
MVLLRIWICHIKMWESVSDEIWKPKNQLLSNNFYFSPRHELPPPARPPPQTFNVCEEKKKFWEKKQNLLLLPNDFTILFFLGAKRLRN